ncbi:Tudor/PWWP/MBT superfamily protein, putative isoform 3 [Theobroma cacao]|uniref:Tudor/PWWP/MBT superfamily protein, putative isoform 3 n=1 Tax=Theobroma cacao TaxID=3641 RepID=A0A061F0G3_THECC|nr:Tudor/PWWP/MBT superfamily protein, putative isoform 3 [Theobroma cacao]
MTKKKAPGKKKQKIKELNHIDNVPQFTKLSRKAASKAKRSSSSSPASPSTPGSLPECSYDRDEASSVTLTSFDDKKDGRKKLHDSVYCRKSWGKRPGFELNFYEFPVVESVALNKVSDPCSGRIVQKVVEQDSDKKKLKVTGSNGVCITPGNVVWAKTACQVWWPAEIIGQRSILADSRIQHNEEHVLVKFYGKHNSAWVNAARDLSMLEDALVQRKEHIKSCRQLPRSHDSSSHSDQQDRKSGKWTSSTSSKTGSNLVKQGGSKKEPKPTIHLDDATFPSKSAKGARRIKIMRYLGLTAPIGSPF